MSIAIADIVRVEETAENLMELIEQRLNAYVGEVIPTDVGRKDAWLMKVNQDVFSDITSHHWPDDFRLISPRLTFDISDPRRLRLQFMDEYGLIFRNPAHDAFVICLRHIPLAQMNR